MLRLQISHSVLSIRTEKRYNEDLTVGELKSKLEMVVGTGAGNQIVQRRDRDGNVLSTLMPDTATLKHCGLQDLDYIHVVDTDPTSGVVAALDSLAKGTSSAAVPEYKIDEEAYARRDDTFAKFKETHLKDFYDSKKKASEERKQIQTEAAKKMKVGDRFEMKEGVKNRGKIAFIGETEFKPGIWVGLIFDEPFGKHNGTVGGKTYFECIDGCGKFVRPDVINVGDYPEIDELADLMSDDDDAEL